MIRSLRQFVARYLVRSVRRQLGRQAELGADVEVARTFAWKLPTNRVSLIVGARSALDGRIVIRGRGTVRIGHHCSFRASTYIGCVSSIVIGSNVFGAEGVFISDNNNHPTSPKARRAMTETKPGDAAWSWDRADVESLPIVIEDDVWLGRNAMILKGVRIGRGSIVAAGAVVAKSVPPFSVVAGNPARIVKSLVNDLDD